LRIVDEPIAVAQLDAATLASLTSDVRRAGSAFELVANRAFVQLKDAPDADESLARAQRRFRISEWFSKEHDVEMALLPTDVRKRIDDLVAGATKHAATRRAEFDKMSVAELKDRCVSRRVSTRGLQRKPQLIEALVADFLKNTDYEERVQKFLASDAVQRELSFIVAVRKFLRARGFADQPELTVALRRCFLRRRKSVPSDDELEADLGRAVYNVRRKHFNAGVDRTPDDDVATSIIDDARSAFLSFDDIPLTDPVADAKKAATDANRMLAVALTRRAEFTRLLDIAEAPSGTLLLGSTNDYAMECRFDGRVMAETLRLYRGRTSFDVDKHYRVAGSAVFARVFVLVDSKGVVSMPEFERRTTNHTPRSLPSAEWSIRRATRQPRWGAMCTLPSDATAMPLGWPARLFHKDAAVLDEALKGALQSTAPVTRRLLPAAVHWTLARRNALLNTVLARGVAKDRVPLTVAQSTLAFEFLKRRTSMHAQLMPSLVNNVEAALQAGNIFRALPLLALQRIFSFMDAASRLAIVAAVPALELFAAAEEVVETAIRRL
jgi:hypothetical protein